MLPKSLRPLLPYLKRYRWGYAAGTLCVFLTNGIWILFPLVLGRAADDLREGVYPPQTAVSTRLAARHRRRQGHLPVPDALDRDRQSRATLSSTCATICFAQLESLSYSYYQRHRTGDIMARATNDSERRSHAARPRHHVFRQHLRATRPARWPS